MSDGDVICVFGAAGSGKSTILARSVAQDWKDGACVVALDITDSLALYSEHRHNVPADAMVVVQTAAEARRAMDRTTRFIIMRPLRPETSIAAVASEWLTVTSELRRGVVYVVDESELAFPNLTQGLDDRQLRISMLARNKGSRVYLAGKRPQQVHTTIRSVATDVLVMHLDSQRAVTYGCGEWGDASLFARAPTLPQFAGLYRERFRQDTSAELPLISDVRTAPLPWPAMAVSK